MINGDLRDYAPWINRQILRLEFDRHVGSDGEYDVTVVVARFLWPPYM